MKDWSKVTPESTGWFYSIGESMYGGWYGELYFVENGCIRGKGITAHGSTKTGVKKVLLAYVSREEA